MSLIPFNNWGGPFPIQPPPPHPQIHSSSSLSLVARTVTVGEEEEDGGRWGGRSGGKNKIQRRTGDKAQNVILHTFSMRAFHHYSKISF